MSQKIIADIFAFLNREGAERLIIESPAGSLGFGLSFRRRQSAEFFPAQKTGKNLRGNLNAVLRIAPGELAAKKYCQITDKNGQTAFYLTILPGEYGEKNHHQPGKKRF